MLYIVSIPPAKMFKEKYANACRVVQTDPATV
jgi:hypothetical protein